MSACPTLSELIGAPGLFDIPDEVREGVVDGFLPPGDLGRYYRAKPRGQQNRCDVFVGRFVRPSMLVRSNFWGRQVRDWSNFWRGRPRKWGEGSLDYIDGAERRLENLRKCLSSSVNKVTGEPLVGVKFVDYRDYEVASDNIDVFKEARKIECFWVRNPDSIDSDEAQRNVGDFFRRMTKVETVIYTNSRGRGRDESHQLGTFLDLIPNVRTVHIPNPDDFIVFNAAALRKKIKDLDEVIIGELKFDLTNPRKLENMFFSLQSRGDFIVFSYMAQFLILRGLDINARSRDGRNETFLIHFEKKLRNPEFNPGNKIFSKFFADDFRRALLRVDADPDLVDSEGKSARDYAGRGAYENAQPFRPDLDFE